MKTRTGMLLALLGTLIATPALALDLQQARQGGLVGEKTDGYLAALATTPDVKSFVGDINAKRKQEYVRISKEKGQPVDVVAKLAAQQIVAKLPSGSRYQAPDGSWKQK